MISTEFWLRNSGLKNHYRFTETEGAIMKDVKTIKVTSDDLHEGKWDDSISNTAAGENASPQLSWDWVQGAGEYVIYMIDEYDTDFWLHWRAYGILDNYHAHGEEFAEEVFNEYVGPYPPEGVHEYVVYVFALKGPASSYPGNFDAESVSVDVVREGLDQAEDGGDGNILAEGSIKGTYAAV